MTRSLKDLAGTRKSRLLVKKYIVRSGSSKKARMMTSLATELNVANKSHKTREGKRAEQWREINKEVVCFLTRDDNATCLPGKKDAVTINKKRIQKYILNDTMKNLQMKFSSENPNKCSRSYFFKCRPRNILPVSYAKRRVCLCKEHQNVALKLNALKDCGFIQNPDKFIGSTTVEQATNLLSELPGDSIEFQTWKSIEKEHNGKTIKKVGLTIERQLTKDFKQDFLLEMPKFKSHCDRMINQFEHFKSLRDGLTPREITVQIDFAENYACSYSAEIQSAYYSKDQITIHPAVFHFKSDGSDKLEHKSIVLLSDETEHKTPTIFAFIRRIVSWIKENRPDVTTVFYVSDSPTSQYRNSSIFGVLAAHKELFGLNAGWGYFEGGHGKGPCDGVGGAAKRTADLAIKTMKPTKIGTAQEFLSAVTSVDKSEDSALSYLVVSREEVTKAREDLTKIKQIPLYGTMKLHNILIKGDMLYWRNVSCFKECCWRGTFSMENFNPTCAGWVEKSLQVAPPAAHVEVQSEPQLKDYGPVLTRVTSVGVGKFVAIQWEAEMYIAKITEELDDERRYCFKFLQQEESGEFKWPRKDDVLWVDEDSIVQVLTSLQPKGRSARSFILTDDEEKMLFGLI